MLNVIALSVAAVGFAAIAAYNIGLKAWGGLWNGTPRTYWMHLALLYNLSAFSLCLAFRTLVIPP